MEYPMHPPCAARRCSDQAYVRVSFLTKHDDTARRRRGEVVRRAGRERRSCK